MFCLVLTTLVSTARGDTCVACDEGTFCFNESLGVCPPHSTSPPESDNIADCTCNAGFYAAANHSCIPCPVNSFCPGDESRQACPARTVTQFGYHDAVTDCACMAGFTGNNGGPCTACASGHYKAVHGTSACQECPQGTFNIFFASDSSDACTPCPEGERTTGKGKSSPTDCEPQPGRRRRGLGTFRRFVRLGMGMAAFEPGAFDTTRQGKLRQAIAAAAGVTVGKVRIVRVSVRASGGRRLLSAGTSAETTVESETFDGNTAESAINANLDGFDVTVDSVSEEQVEDTTTEVCGPGTFSATDGASACTDCSQGAHPITTYSVTTASTSADDCLDCPSNTVINASVSGDELTDCICNAGYTGPNGGACSACLPGTFKDSIGSALCADCPPNTYSTSTAAQSQTTCASCGANSESPSGSDAAADCWCDAGYGGSAGVCSACPAGTFHPNAVPVAVCQPCPPNTFSTGTALTCTGCHAFSSSAEGSASRSACVCNAGFQRTGPAECQACAPGSYAASANSSCVLCEAGSYAWQVNSTACESCPAHSSTATTGSTSQLQCVCAAGYAQTTTDAEISCAVCGPGTFSVAGASSCSDCGPSTYQPAAASTSCRACTANSSHTVSGASESTQCLCHAGFSLQNGECVPCAPGHFKSDAGNQACTACAAGSFAADHGAAACTTCPENTVQENTGQTACVACPGNSSSPAGSSTTTDCKCNPGFETINNVACALCKRGSYQSTHSLAACALCPAGSTTSKKGATDPTECTPCPADTYAADVDGGAPVSCEPCLAHSTSDAGSDGLEDCKCNAGFQPGDYPGHCVECALGSFKSFAANQACLPCPSGMQGNAEVSPRTSISACVDCPAGTYESNNICYPCPANSLSPSGSSSSAACQCDAGFTGTGPCTPCSPGSHKPSPGSALCADCQAGTYSDTSAATACLSCPSFTTSQTNSDAQTDCKCVDGFVGPSGGPCEACVAGKYEDRAQDLCVSCPAGQYYPVSQPPYFLYRCLRCPANAASIPGAYGIGNCTCVPGFSRDGSNCSACPAGSFCPDQFSTVQCPPHSLSESASAAQTDCTCSPGFVGPDGGPCAQCPVNSFCAGGETSTPCPPNATTQGRAQQTNVSACVCNPGWFESEGECARCPEDSYCFNDAEYTCPEHATAVKGSDNLVDCHCDAGLRLVGVGLAARCEACPINVRCVGGDQGPVACASGANVTNGKCKCAPGSSCSTLDESCDSPALCTLCPPGFFCSDNTRTACIDNSSSPAGSSTADACVCNDGWYRLGTTCAVCPLHAHCSDDQLTTCADWDPKLITTDRFNSRRDHCECSPGFFRVSTLDTCKPCPRNYYCPSESTVALPNVVACFPNEYTEQEGSVSREQCICDAGHKMSSDGQATKCLPCAEGERCQNGEVVEFQCHFLKRTANDDHTKCVCIEGFYEDAALSCRPCAPGTVKAQVGDEACTPCPPDHLAVNTTHCRACAELEHAPSGAFQCECRAPRVRDPAGACVLCPVNTFHTPGETAFAPGTCTACPSNSSTNSSSGIGAAAVTECACDPGFVLREGSVHACDPCPAHFYEENGKCIACGSGAHAPPASASEAACTCNVTSCQQKLWRQCYGACEPDVEDCDLCPPGEFKNLVSPVGNTLQCSPCALDRYSDSSGTVTCSFCAHTRQTLQTRSTSVSNCTCRPGFEPPSPNDHAANCTACALGFAKSDPGDVACHACPIGKFAPRTGMTACLDCALHTPVAGAHTTATTASYLVSQCVCHEGLFLDAPSSSCLPCVAGSFKHEVGMQVCNFCGGNVSHYDAFLHHHYGANETGADSVTHCRECPPNSGQDAALIGPPPLGVMNEITDCLCFGGFDSFSPVHGCRICDLYYHRVGFGLDACALCGALEYWIDTWKPCQKCAVPDEDPAEKPHSVVVNSAIPGAVWGTSELDCTCNLGYQRIADTCFKCVPGFFRSDVTAAHCIECPLHTFSTSAGTIHCTACPPHSFTPGNGSTHLTDCLCEAGFAWNGTACDACIPGFFKASADSPSHARMPCDACTSPKYSDAPAATACTACGVNMHSEEPRDSVATCECNPGYGGSPCGICPTTSYSAGGLASDQHRECQACPAGKETLVAGSTLIDECQCLPGHGTSDVAPNATCVLCADGYYAPGRENAPCRHCGFGGVTEPETGAVSFDSCMCNHEIGLFEA